jgi:uncharacterized membrane protein YeaQ/YmgE (transglycosylase-associated protein family)
MTPLAVFAASQAGPATCTSLRRAAAGRAVPAVPRVAGSGQARAGIAVAPLQPANVRNAQGGDMGIIGWIVFGLIVGIIAKFLMPGRDPGGFVITAIIGIVGALIGGFVGRAIGWYNEGDPVGFVMAVIGAIILLAIYRAIAGRPARV